MRPGWPSAACPVLGWAHIRPRWSFCRENATLRKGLFLAVNGMFWHVTPDVTDVVSGACHSSPTPWDQLCRMCTHALTQEMPQHYTRQQFRFTRHVVFAYKHIVSLLHRSAVCLMPHLLFSQKILRLVSFFFLLSSSVTQTPDSKLCSLM